MDDTPSPDPWTASSVDPHQTAHRAGWLVWAIAALEILGGGCMGLGMAAMATLPAAEFAKLITEAQARQGIPPQQAAMITQSFFGAVAVGMFIMVFLPGLAYVVLGFGVHAGRPIWSLITLILTTMQAIVLGLTLLMSVLGSLMNLNLVGATVSIIVLGTPLFLLITAMRWLWRVRDGFWGPGGRSRDDQIDPWNQPDANP